MGRRQSKRWGNIHRKPSKKVRLIVFDMDGVIFQHDNFWHQMHEAYNTLKEGKRLERLYLKTDIKRLADLVIKNMWRGRSTEPYFNLIKNAKYNLGVKETFKELKKRGYTIFILTSGPSDLAKRAQKELDADYMLANELMIEDNTLTGEYDWKLEFNGKGKVLKKFCNKHNIDLKDVIAVGDNENDISKAKIVGKFIAFNSKSQALKNESHMIVESDDLKDILKHIP